jgi:co-chaperonin GroES (HSP10)
MGLRWKDTRPLHLWLIVKGDPRVKKTKGGIYLTEAITGIERVMEGTGHLLRVGDRDEIRGKIGYDLEPGMRVCYRGFLKDAVQGFDAEGDNPVFMIRAEDVMAVIEEDVQLGAFS